MKRNFWVTMLIALIPAIIFSYVGDDVGGYTVLITIMIVTVVESLVDKHTKKKKKED